MTVTMRRGMKPWILSRAPRTAGEPLLVLLLARALLLLAAALVLLRAPPAAESALSDLTLFNIHHHCGSLFICMDDYLKCAGAPQRDLHLPEHPPTAAVWCPALSPGHSTQLHPLRTTHPPAAAH